MKIHIEKFKIFAPKGLSPKQIMDIIYGYGLSNDSLSDEPYDNNTVEYLIKIDVEKI